MSIKRYVAALKRMNWSLVVAMVLLAAGSIAFIYSASYGGPGQPMPSLFKWQAIWFGVGLSVFLVSALVDYRSICQWAAVWYALAVGRLGLVLVIGRPVHGARSWLGVGRLGVQPVGFAR